jgi:hypothetical protein
VVTSEHASNLEVRIVTPKIGDGLQALLNNGVLDLRELKGKLQGKVHGADYNCASDNTSSGSESRTGEVEAPEIYGSPTFKDEKKIQSSINARFSLVLLLKWMRVVPHISSLCRQLLLK